MDKEILAQVKKFIKSMKAGDSLTNLRKTSYAEGYIAGLDAVSDIINMGESFKEKENG